MKHILIIISFLTLTSCMHIEEPYADQVFNLHITNYTDVPVDMSFYFH